jgi:hypothetical protein
MKQFLFFFLFTFALTLLLLAWFTVPQVSIFNPLSNKEWEIRSIDTMKYSRDNAREKVKDPTFDSVIEKQMTQIADTGANYVAIGTPYDGEFVPYLKRWVASARKHNLRVWFRGNFSGWEGWFNYPRINETTHIAMTEAFILENSDIFEDGDIFTPCPECENGIKLDFSKKESIEKHREFLIQEYNVATDAFLQINKDVRAGYYSMNGDVAKAMMDPSTTEALGGVVVIDHYVDTPERLIADIKYLAHQSGGSIILGEFGVPVTGIHPEMTDEEQKQWIEDAFWNLARTHEVKGINYWVNMSGSSAIWDKNGFAKPAVSVIKLYYSQP